MASRLRLFTKRIFIIANAVVVALFLLACLASYLNPERWWFISVLNLAFPFLILLAFLFFVFWIFIKPRLALISLVALIVGWKNTSQLFALNKKRSFDYTKKKDELRIVSWNVARFIEMKRNNNRGSKLRLEMMELLKKQNADILCLQEFFTSANAEYYDNIGYIKKELGYPWFYFSDEPDGYNHWYSSIIFSRLPLIDTGKIYYPKPGTRELLLHADLKFNSDTIRIYTTHLQSVLFEKKDYDKIEKIQHGDDGIVENSRGIFSKLKIAGRIRGRQADAVEREMKKSEYPVIFTGDLNDVPGSYTYSTIRGDMQDAFLEKGFGIGRTFSSLSATLRIDYIFSDRNFTIERFGRHVRNLSDHYMIVTDLKLKK